MIRILLVLEQALLRAALAALLSQENDFDVVGEVTPGAVDKAIRQHRPDVTVVSFPLPDGDGAATGSVSAVVPDDARCLVLMDRKYAVALSHSLADRNSKLGFLARDAGPEELRAAIRRIAQGVSVLDPTLAFAALQARHSPLTGREREVLQIAARGAPVMEIASQLSLTVGTVRNYLSRSIAKTGARTRIEAIRIAQDSGWIE